VIAIEKGIDRHSGPGQVAFQHVHLDSIEAIEAERNAWEAIVREHYTQNPFLDLDWYLIWLAHFARSAVTIEFVKVLENETPVGYFPLCIRPERVRSVRVQVLRFAGNIYSPVNAPVIGHADKTGVVRYFVQRVLPQLDWDLFIAEDLPPEVPGTAELPEELQEAGHRVGFREPTCNWIFHEAGITAPEYFRRLKSNLRNDTRRMPKKLAALGMLHYRMIGRDLAASDIEAYLTVYGRSWKEPEMDPTFHPRLMRAAATLGTLRLGLLFLDERPIAAQLWLLARQRGYVVKTAYDEQFRAYSPGTLLTWWMIERLMSYEQTTFIDYLKGDDGYKRYWTNQRRVRLNMLAYRRSVKGEYLYLVDHRAAPWLRRHPILARWKSRLVGIPTRHRGDKENDQAQLGQC
jgi:CelD/BcsL family acetyltransferase involved in cellulose biosynthesis